MHCVSAATITNQWVQLLTLSQQQAIVPIRKEACLHRLTEGRDWPPAEQHVGAAEPVRRVGVKPPLLPYEVSAGLEPRPSSPAVLGLQPHPASHLLASLAAPAMQCDGGDLFSVSASDSVTA